MIERIVKILIFDEIAASLKSREKITLSGGVT